MKGQEKNVRPWGGLRDPRRSVARCPVAILVGKKLSSIMERACEGIAGELDTLGSEAESPALDAIAAKARSMLGEWLGVGTSVKGVQHEIVAELAKNTKDVDTDVPVWLSGKTPLGIEVPIEPKGVFRQQRT